MLTSLRVPVYPSVSTVSAASHRYRLRSSGSAVYILPRTRTRFGERGFFYSGLAAWNTLPSDLHDITDTSTFRKWLKSVLCDRAYHWLLLALLDVSYSGALQILCWLIDWSILHCAHYAYTCQSGASSSPSSSPSSYSDPAPAIDISRGVFHCRFKTFIFLKVFPSIAIYPLLRSINWILTTRCLSVTGGSSVGKCDRLSQSSWLQGTLSYSYTYLLTYILWPIRTDPRLLSFRLITLANYYQTVETN